MERITDQDLLDLIDNKHGVERSRKLMEEINSDKEILNRYNLLKSIHVHMNSTTTQTPSAHFSEKVMSNLHNPQYVLTATTKFTKRNLLTFLTIAGGILVGIYILATGIVTIPFFEQLTVNPVNLRGNEIDVTPIFDGLTSGTIFKAFLLVDIVIAWFLLDKMVLKPYFESRRKRMAY